MIRKKLPGRFFPDFFIITIFLCTYIKSAFLRREYMSGKIHALVSDFFLIPNLLSLLRVLLAPLAYLSLLQEQLDLIPVCILTVVLVVSDFLDGALARRFNQSTHLGLFLDPLGDKVCLFAVTLGLLVSGRISLLFFIIILAKDILIASGGLFLIGKDNTIIPSNKLGKYTTGFLACSISLFIITEGITAELCRNGAAYNELPAFLTAMLPWIARGGMLMGVFLAMLSLAGYAAKLRKQESRNTAMYTVCAILAVLFCILLIANLHTPDLGEFPWQWL
jgi:cardiolipin synthase